jgi:uncharacterized protein YhfF
MIDAQDGLPKEQKAAGPEHGIDTSVYALWNAYIQYRPEAKNEAMPTSDFFHDNREDALRLARLTLTRKKKASTGLYSLYQKYGVALPEVGSKQIITDFDGKAKAIIAYTQIDTISFDQVTVAYASWDMGTTIEPLTKWKKAHWDFFTTLLKESGEQPSEKMLVVCQQFETIWPNE